MSCFILIYLEAHQIYVTVGHGSCMDEFLGTCQREGNGEHPETFVSV
jgi:hypothetical protein